MPTRDINKLCYGDEGYLANPDDWNESIAEQFAQQEKIILNDEHWKIIRFIRDWYEEKQIAPSARDALSF